MKNARSVPVNPEHHLTPTLSMNVVAWASRPCESKHTGRMPVPLSRARARFKGSMPRLLRRILAPKWLIIRFIFVREIAERTERRLFEEAPFPTNPFAISRSCFEAFDADLDRGGNFVRRGWRHRNHQFAICVAGGGQFL